MLHPDGRSLYTDALAPPPGYVFDEAIGTTYSLDPATLLTIPTHLGLAAQRAVGDTDPVALLEALRRVAHRTTVYAQSGRMQAPRGEHVLFSLLESMVVEVTSPGGGTFHPKLWALRFVDPAGATPILRLLVLSRNLTADRSWDICLQLEGHPARRVQAANRPIADLVRGLPSLAVRAVGDERRDQARKLAGEVARTAWVLPEGFEEVRFHVIRDRPWRPAHSKRLAVVSPFVAGSALTALAETTQTPTALVSRAEELDALDGDPYQAFQRVFVLDEAAESDDGEDVPGRDMFGLHAKAFVAEKGSEVRIYVGSANATTAALVAGKNVEVLTELVGRRRRAGGIDTLLGEAGLGEYIVPWTAPETPGDEADTERLARQELERARQALASADIRVRCVATAGGDIWRLELRGEAGIALEGVRALRAWPITVRDEHAVDAFGLTDPISVDLGAYSLQSVTGLIAFELTAELADVRVRFALNLPLDDPPEGREAAVLRTVLNNHEGFLHYLLLLLGEFGETVVSKIVGRDAGTAGGWLSGNGDSLPLLEEMTRAFSRDPARLREIREIVERLGPGTEVVPEDFRALWAIFEEALDEGPR